MPRLLVIDDRDQTIEMCHRQLPQFDYVTRCDRNNPCQVCEERDRGCPLKCAHDYEEAAQVLGRLPALPDLVVLDLHFAVPEERLLPEDMSDLAALSPTKRRARVEELRRRQGLLILERLRRHYPSLPVVMLTTTDGMPGGAAPPDPLVSFCENEIVDSRTLAAEITRALAMHHTLLEGPVFWGQSPAMAALRRSIGILARSPLPILVEGETGTGKSFLAEHVIHPRSGLKGALVVTDLSTVPPSLLPAHLFGARRGAYTGATEDHAGVFEQAHGGTLFLDEIANLDLDLQRQLLLVLERGVVTRLGDKQSRPAAAKLVAATHQDLEQRVRAGAFRADLYMRLNPATRLRVPPLRERREDLPELIQFAFLEALRSPGLRPLVRAYLARFPTPEDFREEENAVTFGKPSALKARRDAITCTLSQRALGWLRRHPWPGNHRELRLLATNALVFTLAQQLDAAMGTRGTRAPALLVLSDHLLEELLGRPLRAMESPERAPGRPSADGRSVEVVVEPGPSFARIAAGVERQYLMALYDRCAGDLDRMGEALLGNAHAGRRVQMRLNQLGIRLRELRGRSR